MSRKLKCTHCKNTNTTKKGYRKLANKRKVRIGKCHKCQRRFTATAILKEK